MFGRDIIALGASAAGVEALPRLIASLPANLVRLATTSDIPKSKKGVPQTKKRSMSPKDMEKEFGLPTPFVCPECDGPLWETQPGASLQFRCHVGHAYSPDSLLQIMEMGWSVPFGPPSGGSMSGPACCGGSESGSIIPSPLGETLEPWRRNSKKKLT